MSKISLNPTHEFQERLAKLSKDELISIIKEQNPHYIKQINRIEYVFQNLLTHLTWDDGSTVEGRDLTDEELIRLIDPPFIYSKELYALGFTEEQQRQIHIASDPIIWAKHFIGAKPRAYQTLVLRDPSRRKVMRFGRRLGKTYSLALLALWYAYTNTEARILVVSPMKSQVGLIYDEINKMIEQSELVQESRTRFVRSPQYEIEYSNGSTIRFFTSGMKSNSKTDVARGQEADLIILDEMDYMGPDDLIALLAMLQNTDESKTTEKALIGASTPSGLRNTFWKWNTDPQLNFNAYWFPSYVNPGWTNETEQEMRQLYTREQAYRHEIEADWGEVEEGVYPRKYVDLSFRDPGWRYKLATPEVSTSKFVIGVDWDKYTAGVNIVVIEMCDMDYPDERFAGKLKLVYREEADKGEFTYTYATERLIYLNSVFMPDHIYIDRGYGEVQLELLKKYGMEHPETNLHKKTKGFQFSENIEIRDPFTKQPSKKDVKSFMVDNLYKMLEDQRLIISSEDDELYFQLISYVVIRTSSTGKPIFGAGGQAVDHAHDALLLACLAITQNYDELMNVKYGNKPKAISNEVFMPMFSVNSQKDAEIAEDKWGKDNSNAPLMRKRALTADINRRKGRNGMIRRRMF